jgi:membrane protease YdiL (CAAX protease family)
VSDRPDVNGWTPPDTGPDQPYDQPPPQPYGQPQPPPHGEAAPQPHDQAAPQPYGQPQPQPHGEPYGQTPPQAHPQPYGESYGQPQPQAYGQTQPQAYGQTQPQPYPQPYGEPYGQATHPQGYAYPAPYGNGYPPFPGYGPRVKQPWLVAPRPGARYHQVARTAVHRWWRPVVGTLLVLAYTIAAMIVLLIGALIINTMINGGTYEAGDGDSFFNNDTADLGFQLAMLAVLLPSVPLAAWAVQRRRPGTVSSVAGRLRWKWLAACAGLAILFCAVSFVFSLLASGLVPDDTSDGHESWVGWAAFIPPALVIVLLVPFQSAAEEYVFRGWIPQAIGSWTLETRTGPLGRAFSTVFRTPWPGIVVGAALFMAGHGYTGWGMLDVFLFGAIAGWLAFKTGGLESGIAIHVFNNLMAFLLPAAVGKLDIEQGGVPWQYVVADVAPMLLYALAVVWLAKRFRLQRVTPDESVPVVQEMALAPNDSYRTAADSKPPLSESASTPHEPGP